MGRIAAGWAGLSLLFCLFALLRPVDHDESQYVAATVLTAQGMIPYRDFAYLQTPLQPFVFAPVALMAGTWTWPALRIVNALLGLVAVAAVGGAARSAGASRPMALIAALMMASCDILLFSIGTARNDALPVALLAVALWLAMRPGRSRPAAMLAGALLAAATAAKVSYALPALTYGGYALWHRQAHRPLWVAAGAVPVAIFVAWTATLAPQGFVFDTLTFPSVAPRQYYEATHRLWKLGLAIKLVDTIKFLALGPALLALLVVMWDRRWRGLPAWLILAGLLAGWLPSPTWRQYLLPMLPPLFVALALAWTHRSPMRGMRIASVILAVAGLAPSLAAVTSGGGMIAAMRHGNAIRRAMDAAGVTGPVATLSPQFLPATGRSADPRFATGPFYFRGRGLLSAPAERALVLLSHDRLAGAALPRAVLIGGEGPWTSGDQMLDDLLERRVRASGYRGIAVDHRFRLWVAR